MLDNLGEVGLVKKIWIVCAALIGIAPMPATAKINVTLLKGTYEKNNVIRVISTVRLPAPPATAYAIAMLKVATMAGQKGYSRVAVVKIDDCGTIAVNRSPVVQTCKIFGQMLNVGETAQPMGKEPIIYFTIKEQGKVFVPSPENLKEEK